MSDLISRSALLKELSFRVLGIHKANPGWRETHPPSVEYPLMELDCIMDMVKQAEEVDAVEVVRCRECKYFKWGDYCTQDKMEHSKCRPDEFCSCGEKNDGGASDDED